MERWVGVELGEEREKRFVRVVIRGGEGDLFKDICKRL